MFIKKVISRRRIKLIIRRWVVGARQIFWRYRVLPDFIIIGAAKSGTTSLFEYLSQHPQLRPAYRKEIHYFDGGLDPDVDNFAKGEPWYRAHFPLRCSMKDKSKAYEASPLYIFHPLAPKRISEMLPDVRVIALLRNPVDRAVSHYFHGKNQGREPLPPLQAFQAEEERLQPILAREEFKNNGFRHYSYKARGQYHEQLERYLEYFPADNILVLDSDTFFKQTEETLQRVCQFVGVDADYAFLNPTPRNVSRNKTKVDSEVYEYLEDHFSPYNQALYKMLGRKFQW